MTRTIMTVFAVVGVMAFTSYTTAQASSSLNSSRSNVYKSINVSDSNAVAACKKDGGTVAKDPQGKDSCITCPSGQKMTANGCK